jgi:hypothetical protein
MSAEEDVEVEAPPEMIKLVSAEGYEFGVDKRAAMVSGTIKSMLTGPGEFPSTSSRQAQRSSACGYHQRRSWRNARHTECAPFRRLQYSSRVACALLTQLHLPLTSKTETSRLRLTLPALGTYRSICVVTRSSISGEPAG